MESKIGWVVAAIFAVTSLLAITDTAPVGLSPDEKPIALEYCLKPETTVTLVRLPDRDYYEAKYDTPNLRYDFTWQVNGTAVAVEEHRDGVYQKPRSETIDVDFWNCVYSKPLKIKEAAH